MERDDEKIKIIQKISMGCNYYPPTPKWRKNGTTEEKIEYIFHMIGFVLVLPLWLPFIIIDSIFDFTGNRRKKR